MSAPTLEQQGDIWIARFTAMAGPCEVLLDVQKRGEAAVLARMAQEEAWRIERKFSRYRTDNIVARIHQSAGQPQRVDEETAKLLHYAATCHETSGGLFDITSGVLRRAWTFDGGEAKPDEGIIRAALSHVGWRRVTWDGRLLTLPVGMQIDFGGLGKEYAVDRTAALVSGRTGSACVVNFGGDLYASGPRRSGEPWSVGIDDPDHSGKAALYRVELTQGALATSGDARRFVTYQGKRLGHILDPRTGWPVADAPRAVTVLSTSCIEAGTLATLAYLQGPRARAYLDEQGVTAWVL